AAVRPHRRPGRAQVHLPDHHRGDGRVDLRGRPAAHLRQHRLDRADPDGEPAPAAGPRARRRIRRRRDLRRGYDTSWIQTTATLGLFLALLVIWLCRSNMDAKVFAEWGWRLPFWVS